MKSAMTRRVWINAVAAAALGWASASGASAQSLQALFVSANQAYFRGDYPAAARQYEAIEKAGVRDADVYFNLATAYARSGALGKAVLYFERSLKLRPGDADAEKGLNAAVTTLARRRAERAGEATVRTRPPISEALVRPFSESSLAWLVLALDLAFFGILIALRAAQKEATRVGLSIASALSGLLLLIGGAGLLIKSEAFKEGRPGVVLREQAPLREGPDPRAGERAKADEGQPARVLEQDGDFVRVKLPDNAEGWMQQADIGEV